MTLGKKFDGGKAEYALIPPVALEQIVFALQHGKQKYGANNWRYVKELRYRYFSAAMRHLMARLRGEMNDAESGLPHLAHAGCCILFMLAADEEGLDKESECEST